MAANETKIVLTAEDKTAAALTSAQRNLQQMEKSAMMAGAALSAIGVTFSAAAAVAFVKGTIDAADGLNDLSQRVGINIQQLAGWTLAANQSGTSMESVAKGVKGLSVYMTEHSDKLRAAGITATDANGAMTQLADLFEAMPDGVEKTALAVQLFGKAGMDMIPMLNMGSKGLAEAQEKAAKYGERMAQLAPDADKFNDQVAELALHMKALGINVTQFVIEPLTQMATALNDLGAGGDRAEKRLAFLADAGHPVARALQAWSSFANTMGIGVDRSRGYTGPTNGAGLPMSEEEMFSGATDAYMAQRAARARARGLIDKSGAGGAGGGGSRRAFDPDGDFDFKFAEMNRKARREQEEADYKAGEAEAAKAKAMDEKHMARMEQQRIELEGEGAQQEWIDKTTRAIEKQDNAARDLGLTFSSAFEDAIISGKKFGDVLEGLAKDIARIFLRKSVTEPMAEGVSGLFKGGIGSVISKIFSGGSGGGGSATSAWDFGPAMPDLGGFSFAGGGYTGDGARSGGLDGQGGFLAMLHPRETVTDHAMGGGGGGVTVNLTIGVGVAQTVRAEINNLLPSISASVQGAVMDARLRGGSTRAAYRG